MKEKKENMLLHRKPSISITGSMSFGHLLFYVNKNYFTLKEYHIQRDTICKEKNILPSKIAGGFVSLLVKGILIREKDIYSIHYKLIPYMRKKVNLDYGTRNTRDKRKKIDMLLLHSQISLIFQLLLT